MSKIFVLAPDSFKESMTALQACQAMQYGILRHCPDAEVRLCPMADGGEGTLDAIYATGRGKRYCIEVHGPIYGQLLQADYICLQDEKTAIIEMAQANGMHCLAPEQRNPLRSSSYGTGQLIKAALDHQVDKIIIGLGGSVTQDAGLGLLQALGVKFYDAIGQLVAHEAQALVHVQQIDLTELDPRLAHTELVIASDVNHVLIGERGSCRTFAAQKGATPVMIAQLEQGFAHFATQIKQQLQLDYTEVAGAGAAGGLGFALLSFTEAKICSGIALIMALTHFEQQLLDADYVWTGEGCMDAQTLQGKAPWGVAQLAKRHAKTVIACVGSLKGELAPLYAQGFDAIFPIVSQCMTTVQACQQGEQNLRQCSENITRLLCLSESLYLN